MEIKIIRKVDELGRIVIPKQIRERLNLYSGDDIEIAVKKNVIVIRKSKGEA